jgi:hypothetical protein
MRGVGGAGRCRRDHLELSEKTLAGFAMICDKKVYGYVIIRA